MSDPREGRLYYLVDVFTDRVFGGNQLAGFPDARGIAEEAMPKIAAELNLSEVAFALPDEYARHSLTLRIFTPKMELPFAGHPTVGTACVMVEMGHLTLEGSHGRFVFLEGVGEIPVLVERDARGLSARFSVAKMPESGPPAPPIESVARMLGLEPRDVATEESRPRAVSCGVPFLFVELRSPEALARVRMNYSVWGEILERYWAPHVYVIARRSDSVVQTRMFAPAMGIVEDPATGAAAAALAGYLDRATFGDGTTNWTVEQGIEMGRPSRILVSVENAGGRISRIEVGGRSVLVGQGILFNGI